MKESICFVLRGLGLGGVERALVALANQLIDNYDVTVVLFNHKDNALIYDLDDKVNIVLLSKRAMNYCIADKDNRADLSKKFQLYKAFIRLLTKMKIKKSYEKAVFKKCKAMEYDYVISYAGFPGPWDTVAELIKAKNRFAFVHNNPVSLGLQKYDLKEYYKYFDKIVCVSKDIQSKLCSLDSRISSKVCVAYNVVDHDKIRELSLECVAYDLDAKQIVTVARLENQAKRLDRVIEAVDILVKRGYSSFEWHIVGDGADRAKLEQLVRDKKLEKYILFEGFSLNPYKYISRAYIFALTSDYEGLPVTLMESQCLRVPAVVTDFSCASEIVFDGYNGYVVEKDASLIADKIAYLLDNAEIRETLAENALISYNSLANNSEFSFNRLFSF